MPIDLGFLEPIDDTFDASDITLSRLGGLPRWLNPTSPPTVDRILCGQCNQPMRQLFQMYAPDDEVEGAYERLIHVFVCGTAGACQRAGWTKAVKVLRAQCAEGVERGEGKESCVVCACKAPFRCAQCSKTSYCSKEHQALDWKEGGHKGACNPNSDSDGTATETRQNFMFPLMELVSDAEPTEDKPLQNVKIEEIPQTMDESELAQMGIKPSKETYQKTEGDRFFLKFQRRLERDPDQVLRYTRNVEEGEGDITLWLSEHNRLEKKDVKRCQGCGGERTLELQLLPTVLSHLGEWGLYNDWGLINIYSCDKTCVESLKDGYAEELVWHQEVSKEGVGYATDKPEPPKKQEKQKKEEEDDDDHGDDEE
ncbi:hypothetical protein YB2330_004014 [Saitoella coloradoensis]